MKLTLKVDDYQKKQSDITEPGNRMAAVEIARTVLGEKGKGLGAFDRLFKSLLPEIFQAARNYDYQGLDLLDIVAEMSKRFRDALDTIPAQARVDYTYCKFLISTLFQDIIVESKNWKALYRFPRADRKTGRDIVAELGHHLTGVAA